MGRFGALHVSPHHQCVCMSDHISIMMNDSLRSALLFLQIKAWTANPQQFVEDEDDDTFSYSVRISAQDLLLVRWKPSVLTVKFTQVTLSLELLFVSNLFCFSQSVVCFLFSFCAGVKSIVFWTKTFSLLVLELLFSALRTFYKMFTTNLSYIFYELWLGVFEYYYVNQSLLGVLNNKKYKHILDHFYSPILEKKYLPDSLTLLLHISEIFSVEVNYCISYRGTP